jgi:hypothetical protein
MDRSNHYEAAFEGYLRARRLGYVAVDEAHRSTLDDEPVKSLDFVVYGANGSKLVVDVKGRRFPGGPKDRPRRVWETWSTRDDIDGLDRWAERFGDGFVGLLVFVYRIQPTVLLPLGTPDLWMWHDRFYLMRAVPVADYRQRMRVRSPKWGTVMLPSAAFRELARPFRDFVAPRCSVSGVQSPAGRTERRTRDTEHRIPV